MTPRDEHPIGDSCARESELRELRSDMDTLQAVVVGFPPEYEGGLRRDIRQVQDQMKYNAQEAEKSRRRIKFIWMVAIAITGKLSVDGVVAVMKFLSRVVTQS